jgi:phosphoglycerate dehydrogenase-like enzyme
MLKVQAGNSKQGWSSYLRLQLVPPRMLEFQGRRQDGIMSDYKVLIIGLGEIGHSNAEYMASLGLKVD